MHVPPYQREIGAHINPYINKALVALVTVLGAVGVMVSDGITVEDVIAMVILFANAMGVYGVPNAPLKGGNSGATLVK